VAKSTEPVVAVTEGELRARIAWRYALPEWYLEHEVTLGGRRLDIVAFNLYGSKKWRTVGFECKVSRGDWLRELANHRKSEDWCAVVDEFFVVAPRGVVPLDELPRGWGLLEVSKTRMFMRAQPERKQGSTLPREVAACFFRRLAHRAERSAALAKQPAVALEHREREQLREEVRVEHAQRQAQRASQAEVRAAAYERLLADLGFGPWDMRADQTIRAAVKAFRLHGDPLKQVIATIDQLAQHAERTQEVVANARAAFSPEIQ